MSDSKKVDLKSKGAPTASMTLVANFVPVSTTLVTNLPPVSLILAVNLREQFQTA
jgi:hypothetical protein